MATVTGLTADRMQDIIDQQIVDADVIGENLILTKQDGSTIDTGNVRGPGGGMPPRVTVLPPAPVDGDEVHFVADAANGVIWHLKYRAASASPYKWEFVGGAPLYAIVPAQEAGTNANYAALTTPGPSITLPLAGDYFIEQGYQVFGTTGSSATMSYDIGGTAAVDADATRTMVTGTSITGGGWRRKLKTGLAAGIALVSKYKSGAGTSLNWLEREIIVTPRRVG